MTQAGLAGNPRRYTDFDGGCRNGLHWLLQFGDDDLFVWELSRTCMDTVDLSEISPQLAIAAVAAEDQKFPFHHGFVGVRMWHLAYEGSSDAAVL